ncbi:MAG: hypothetical protein ABIP17_01620 [Ilumatobacteraceae bacterium]
MLIDALRTVTVSSVRNSAVHVAGQVAKRERGREENFQLDLAGPETAIHAQHETIDTKLPVEGSLPPI